APFDHAVEILIGHAAEGARRNAERAQAAYGEGEIDRHRWPRNFEPTDRRLDTTRRPARAGRDPRPDALDELAPLDRIGHGEQAEAGEGKALPPISGENTPLNIGELDVDGAAS